MKKSGIKDIMFFVIVIVLVAITVFSKIYGENDKERMIGVHVKGAVKSPGYYELDYGSRVKDAIKYAGGETKEADLNMLNLAMPLRDGEEITVPVTNETDVSTQNGKININTADVYQMCKIEGIGEVLAKSIIEYRAKNGNFKTIDDLKKVSGIGDANFKKFASEITVE